MRHVWSALCQRATVDAETRTVTLNDVVEEITMNLPAGTKLPDATGPFSLPFGMQLVSLWARDDANVAEPATRIRIILKTPRDPQPTIIPELDVDLHAGFQGRTLIKINDVLWRGTGEYVFCVEKRTPRSEWERVAEIPFLVKIVMLPGQPPKDKKPKLENRQPAKRIKKKRR